MPKAAFLILLSLLLHRNALADGFEVRPITIETAGGVTPLVITNPGDQRLYIEAQVLTWTQDAAGNEQLAESDLAIASPPAFWVQPHASYTMRVKLPPAGAREGAFRIVLKQLPERGALAQGRVVFALTQNLPAFVIGAAAPPALSARLLDPTHVLLENHGGRRVRVTGVNQNGARLGTGLLGYALAGGALRMTLARPVQTGQVELETDLGPRSVAIR